MTDERKGYLQLVLFCFFIGAVGTLVKLVRGFDVYSIIFFRYAIAAVFIFAVIWGRKRTRELALTSPLQTLMVGLCMGLATLFYFSSILHTSVSNAVFLLYTAPIFSVILAKLFLKEHIEKETIIGTVITLAGIFFILDPRTFSLDSKETLGNLMGLAAGFFYAAQALVAKPILRTVSGYYTAFWQSLIVSIMFVFFVKIESTEVLLSNWWQLLAIGTLCAGISSILFMEGAKRVSAQKIFIITSLEPLIGTIYALLFLREIPMTMTIIGAVLIIYGVYRVTITKKKITPVAQPATTSS